VKLLIENYILDYFVNPSQTLPRPFADPSPQCDRKWHSGWQKGGTQGDREGSLRVTERGHRVGTKRTGKNMDYMH